MHGLCSRVKLRPPEAQDIVRLVDECAAVERAERRRVADVQNEHSARAHEQVQPVQHLRQLLRRQIVKPVERAVGRVDRAVKVEIISYPRAAIRRVSVPVPQQKSSRVWHAPRPCWKHCS